MALITGGSGFLGSALAAALRSRGHTIVCADGRPPEGDAQRRDAILYTQLVRAFRAERVEVVFHLAGSGVPDLGEENTRRQYEANLEPAKALAMAIDRFHYRGRVVVSSSASVYGNTGVHAVREDDPVKPCSDYGAAKLEAETYLRDTIGATCDLRIARLFHLFGPGQQKLVVYELARRLVGRAGPLVMRGTGQEVRDFVFVRQAIRALYALGLTIPKGPETGVVNLCTGHGMKILEVARLLSRLDSREAEPIALSTLPDTNPVSACVGSGERLARLGLRLLSARESHFQETLCWVRRQVE